MRPVFPITMHPVSPYRAGTIKSMVPGQKPISLVTDNVRVTVTHDLVTSLKNTDLAPPKTTAEVIYSFCFNFQFYVVQLFEVASCHLQPRSHIQSNPCSLL
jgi:hypothetical protein